MTAATKTRNACDDFPFMVDRTIGPWSFQRRKLRLRSSRETVLLRQSELQRVFNELLNTWRRETWYISSVRKRTSHPAYLKLIALGPQAVPLIIDELRKQPDQWFVALESITREDPGVNATNMRELSESWLAWAEAHGY
jgi:hypothetical protein